MPFFGTEQLKTLSSVSIRGPFPAEGMIKAGDLWSDTSKPCVIFAIRRMG